MNKVSGICVYRNNEIIAFKVRRIDGELVDLFTSTMYKNQHATFQEMYKHLLDTVKQNNKYFSYYVECGVKWYDIAFIDADSPYLICKYPYIGCRYIGA